MKPFDYELAKQKGVKLCTADGRAARIVCHDMKGHPNEMVVIVETKDRNEEIPLVYYKNGRPYSAGKNFHLRIQSEPRYLNVFQNEKGSYYTTGKLYESEDLAKSLENNEKGTYVKTIKIEI